MSLASIEGSVTDGQALLKESTVGSDFGPPGHPLNAHDVVSSGDRFRFWFAPALCMREANFQARLCMCTDSPEP